MNANGSLDLGGMDRVTQVRSQVYNDTSLGAWYLQRQAYIYNQDNNGTALLQSESFTRLVPYLGNGTELAAGKVMTEARTYDVFRNLTIQTAVVDRASRLATVTTNLPDSSVDAVVTSLNGRNVRSVTAQNLTYDTYYDALGRVVKTTDPRIDTSSTARIGYYTSGAGQTGQVAWREDSAGNRTNYAYESATGRLSSETDPLGKVARYAYTTRGQVYRTWGDTTYPVEHAFNDYGEQITLSTFRGGTGWNASTWPSSPGTADLTTWAFDPASGSLTSKTDAVSQVTTYTYTTRGQLKTRQWARGVTATYAYSSATADLTGVDYSDSTTDLAYTYNRLGQTATVTDVTGTRSFNYSSATTQLTREDLGSFVGTRSLSYTYDTTGTGTKGRLTQLGAGLTSNPGAEYALGYGYDTYGRLNQASTFTYAYTAGSNLLASIYDTASAWTQTRTYESNRNLLDVIETKYSTTSKARFDYTNDTLGRRTGVAKTGQMYARYSSAGLDTVWGYNDRSELTSESSKLGGTSTTLAGRDDAYDFDHIGNRKSVTRNGSTSTYSANALNQYTQTTDPGVIDVTGMAPAAATVTVNGSSTGVTRQNDWYYKPFSVTNTSTAVWSSLTIASSAGGSENRSAFVPLTPEAFSHDVDGNLTSDGRWTYTYDAENRLVAMQTQTALSPSPFPNADARRIEFKNDYLGRRVQKTVRAGYNGSTFTTVVSDEKFVYAGWNLVLKLNAASSNALVASYYWGLDWSGTMQGAGGVGGLLKVQEGGNTYLPMFDGNANVMGMVRASTGSIDAAYEYDAFGRTLRETGSYAASNSFRFSTKYADTESGLIYYGLRYYSPSLGRFVTRDPIEEQGGLNLYGFVRNNAVNRWDYLGMRTLRGKGVTVYEQSIASEGDEFRDYGSSEDYGFGGMTVYMDGRTSGSIDSNSFYDQLAQEHMANTYVDPTPAGSDSETTGGGGQVSHVNPNGEVVLTPFNATAVDAPNSGLPSPESLSGLFNSGSTINPVTGQLVVNRPIDIRFNISPQGSTGGINWGQVGQGTLTLVGGLGGMIGGAALAGTTAPTVAGAVVGATAMVAGATSFGLGMTTIANGFTGGRSVQTPTGTIPQGIVELGGAMTGNPNLQNFGGYGDVLLSTATPPRWGGPLAAGSAYIFRSDFDANAWPFGP